MVLYVQNRVQRTEHAGKQEKNRSMSHNATSQHRNVVTVEHQTQQLRSSSSSSSKARPQAPGSFLLLEWFCWFFRVRGGGGGGVGGGMLMFTQTQK